MATRAGLRLRRGGSQHRSDPRATSRWPISLRGEQRCILPASTPRLAAVQRSRLGTKGERLFDWAMLPWLQAGCEDGRHFLVIRRCLDDPEQLTYYLVFAPPSTPLSTIVQAIGARWRIEEDLEATKDLGLDQYARAQLPWLVSSSHPRHARLRLSRWRHGPATSPRLFPGLACCSLSDDPTDPLRNSSSPGPLAVLCPSLRSSCLSVVPLPARPPVLGRLLPSSAP